METFLQDMRHSLRMARQSPAFSITAIAALALARRTARVDPVVALRTD